MAKSTNRVKEETFILKEQIYTDQEPTWIWIVKFSICKYVTNMQICKYQIRRQVSKQLPLMYWMLDGLTANKTYFSLPRKLKGFDSGVHVHEVWDLPFYLNMIEYSMLNMIECTMFNMHQV